MLMDYEKLTGPYKPWPEDFQPLTQDEAVEAIVTGNHRQAREMGQRPATDARLVTLLMDGKVACAYTPDGNLKVITSLLNWMQRWN